MRHDLPATFASSSEPADVMAALDAVTSSSLSAQWSRWARCESSFSLLLVPHRPGVYALAEDVAAIESGRRTLAVFHVAAADDLARAVSRLFAAESPLRARLAGSRCYLRYSQLPSVEARTAVASALQRWLTSAHDAKSADAADLAARVGPYRATAVPAELQTFKTALAAEEQPMKLNQDLEHTFTSDCDPGDEDDTRYDEPGAPSVSEPPPAAPSLSEPTRSAADQRVGMNGDSHRSVSLPRNRAPFPAGF